VGLLDFLRKRRKAEARPRLGAFMTPREMEEWWALLKRAPGAALVAPKVPLVLLLEEAGELGEDLLSEVVPYVVVSAQGAATRAYVRRGQEHLWTALRAAGLEVSFVEEALENKDVAEAPLSEAEGKAAPPSSAVSPPPAASPPFREGEAGEEEAEREPPPQDREEEKEEGADLYADLARAWWSGTLDPKTLFPEPPLPPVGEGEKGEGSRAAPAESAQARSPRQAPAEQREPACPLCGASMVLRTAKKGKRAGQQFWSCSRWPECRGTRPYRPPKGASQEKKSGE